MKKVFFWYLGVFLLCTSLLSQYSFIIAVPKVTNTNIKLNDLPYISINGNNEFFLLAQQEGWEGNGSVTNPYIIKDLKLNASATSKRFIEINNTDVYFQIKDCTLYGTEGDPSTNYSLSVHCIYFTNVTNGIILNNVIRNFNESGITIANCINIIIEKNNIREIQNGGGVDLSNSSNISVTNNSITYCGHAIASDKSFNVEISRNYISGTDKTGISLTRSKSIIVNKNNASDSENGILRLIGSDYNIISNNSFFEAQWGYIYLYESNFNILSYNELFSIHHKTRDIGIEIWRSINNSLCHNYIHDCDWGIELRYSNSSLIYQNTLIEDYFGISISRSKDNMISENSIFKSDDGIEIYFSFLNLITKNNISLNSYGIRLLGYSAYNKIVGNNISRNSWGIYVYSLNSTTGVAHDNVITENTISQNRLNGIHIKASSNNVITENTISQNGVHGISIEASSQNNITRNFISENGELGIFQDLFFNNVVQDNQRYLNLGDIIIKGVLAFFMGCGGYFVFVSIIAVFRKDRAEILSNLLWAYLRVFFLIFVVLFYLYYFSNFLNSLKYLF